MTEQQTPSEPTLADSFRSLGLLQPLLHRLEEHGFKEPTPIQAQAIPYALEGNDVLGTAQTGTGKTIAFGVPLIMRLMEQKQGSALVLLPTRELAMQVMKSLQVLLGRGKIESVLLIGGDSMDKQCRKLKAKPRLIVGTPGRINDHLRRRTLTLSHTRFLVLDEVDRMLDMGFGIQLEEIQKHLSDKRQTLMFSATLPKKIEALTKRYLSNPVRVSVGEVSSVATNVKQSHLKVMDGDKYPKLVQELESRVGSIIVFVKTKHSADRMALKLRKAGHRVEALHGDLRQGKRNRVITGFRELHYRILVATDVAARGLDIPHIEHVINYDLPQNPEDYIHRIGRTARAGANGEALSFLSPGDNGKWKSILRLLQPGSDQGHTSSKPSKSKHRPSKSRTRKFRYRKKSKPSHSS